MELDEMKDGLGNLKTTDLFELRAATQDILKARIFEQLQEVVGQYVAVYGEKQGMEEACDHLFKRFAPAAYPGGWAALLQYATKAAG